MVQVGNEINTQMLRPADTKGVPIDWARNAKILNAGIRAVREAHAADGASPKVMLHVAQPENVEPWFAAATAAGRARLRLHRRQLLPEVVHVRHETGASAR